MEEKTAKVYYFALLTSESITFFISSSTTYLEVCHTIVIQVDVLIKQLVFDETNSRLMNLG